MVDFVDILTMSLYGKKEDKIINIGQTNQVIDREKTCTNSYTKNEMEIYKKYGLTPEEVALIEEELHIGIEKVHPRKLNEKKDKNMGLDSRVIKYIEKNINNDENDFFIQ